MSAIYFDSPSGRAELAGPERHNMACLTTDSIKNALSFKHSIEDENWADAFVSLFPADHHIHQCRQVSGKYIANNLWCLFSQSRPRDQVALDGEPIDFFTVALNTVLAMGNDSSKLLARLNGQCELHCWCDGPNRAWLAKLIEYGRASSLMRADMGWESIVALLRSRDDEPVVCSFSGSSGFPYYEIARSEGFWTPLIGPEDDYDVDQFDALPLAIQWDLSMKGLRLSNAMLEMKPDDWETYYFGRGLNGFQLSERLWQIAKGKGG